MSDQTTSITRAEAMTLCDYAHRIADRIPNGLSSLSDALTFAGTDLLSYSKFGFKIPGFNLALTFIQSIPKFEDLESKEFFDWMNNDIEHLKYWK